MPRFAPVKFTDRYVAALKPKARRRVVFDAAEPGFGVRLTPGGTRTWVYVYRIGAQVRFLTIGHYPAMPLAEARKLARAASVRVDKGTDPAAEKRAAKLGETFGELAMDYLEKWAKKRKRSWQEDGRILRAELLPHWRHRKVREMTRRDVRERIEVVAERAPTMANRVWALVSRIFNYAIERDWIDANPASRIAKQPEVSRDRVLTDDEICALWAALVDAKTLRRVDDPTAEDAPARVSPTIARGLQVQLLTAQRPGEVFAMRWTDVDANLEDERVKAGWWTIPAEYSKNREPHRVPLVEPVVTLLREAKGSGPNGNRWVFAGKAGSNVTDRAKKAAAVLSRALGFEFHRHDLRRTAASNMAAAGIGRDTISKVLNHVDRGARATAVYDRYSYDAEKQTALEAWARRLQAILDAKPDQAGRLLTFARA